MSENESQSWLDVVICRKLANEEMEATRGAGNVRVERGGQSDGGQGPGRGGRPRVAQDPDCPSLGGGVTPSPPDDPAI